LVRCCILIGMVCGLVLSAVGPSLHRTQWSSLLETAPLLAQGTRTDLMQQSDYKHRLNEARKTGTEERGPSPVEEALPAAAVSDYLVLVLLAVSVVILAFVASRQRRTRFRL
jgi:hypothetical protein